MVRDERMRWGVIGAGGFADQVAIPAIQRTPSGVVQALTVRNLERANLLAHKHGVPQFFTDPADLLTNPKIDAVYICTPEEFHAQYAILAAHNGKHVCCEKPMALSSEECQQMIAACEGARVKLMPAFMMRFHPTHQKIRTLIREGAIGEIVQARIQFSYWYPPDSSWRQHPKNQKGGGALWDLGSHAFDLLRFLTQQEITGVQAFVDTIIHGYPGNDTAICSARLESGAIGIIDVGFTVPSNEGRLEVYGTEGTMYGTSAIDPSAVPRAWIVQKGVTQEITTAGDCYAEQFEHFARCVLQDIEPTVNGYDGLSNVRVLEAIGIAANSQRYTRVETIPKNQRSPLS